jgi:hypothetical protein
MNQFSFVHAIDGLGKAVVVAVAFGLQVKTAVIVVVPLKANKSLTDMVVIDANRAKDKWR